MQSHVCMLRDALMATSIWMLEQHERETLNTVVTMLSWDIADTHRCPQAVNNRQTRMFDHEIVAEILSVIFWTCVSLFIALVVFTITTELSRSRRVPRVISTPIVRFPSILCRRNGLF